MDIQIFQRAEEHRSACGEKFDGLTNTPDFVVAARLWSEFLVNHHRWFTRMQQALQRGPSAAWLGELKARRGTDPLLQYLQQARHADEHGLERIVAAEAGGVGIGAGGGLVRIDRLEIRNGVITHLSGSQDGGPLKIRITRPHLKLVPVRNRGLTFNPPRCNNDGEPYSADQAAKECLDAMESIAAEAKKFFD
ncbi:hypothetical protein [Novosphingobium sp.]|uniref:hypothetical protein n=1 Tax=Novosphingobium sp. TaxID=1874826 RepID=UPI0038B95ECD